jgi:hypothetical protein
MMIDPAQGVAFGFFALARAHHADCNLDKPQPIVGLATGSLAAAAQQRSE